MQLKPFLCSSVGRKFILAATGLALSGFVLGHMSGNMLLFCGPEAFNKYGHKLVTMPGFVGIELGLALCFLVHIGLAMRLTIENRFARPIATSQRASNCDKDARLGSRWMALTGLLVLSFLILHLATFKYGAHYTATYDGVEMRDLYKLVVEEFQKPWYSGVYIFSMLALWLHLVHGFSAVFQSIGFSNVRHKCLAQLGWAFSILVAGGFISQPIYIFLSGGVQ